jgi:hypothetical protein
MLGALVVKVKFSLLLLNSLTDACHVTMSFLCRLLGVAAESMYLDGSFVLGAPGFRQCSGAAMPSASRVCRCVMCVGLLVCSKSDLVTVLT